MKASDELINELLDAAFRELQHDTGDQDIEYRHQRALLERKFREILRKRRRTKK